MATALNYAKQYSNALEQAFPYSLYFGALYATPNNGRYRWTSERTIEMATIATTGRVDSDRDTIATAVRNYTNSWTPRTLENERKWSTLVHPRDIDETNMVTSIQNITQVYNDEQKFPEMDAYTISKLYSAWTTEGKTAKTTALTTDNILDVIDEMNLDLKNARVTPTGKILYVTHEVKRLIDNAKAIQRTLDVQTSADMVNRNVNSLDGIEIIGVPSELMKSLYDFTEGWAVGTTADQINMLLVHPNAVITPTSYEFSNLSAPSAVTEGKYVYYEESHEDVFILPNKATSLSFHVTKYVAPTP